MPTTIMPLPRNALFALLLSSAASLIGCSDPEPTADAQPDRQPASAAQTTLTEETVNTAPMDEATAQAAAISHPITEHLYRCTDGEEFSIRFGDQSATLRTSEDQFELRQQPAASGIRYADDAAEFLSEGDQAIFMVEDQSHDCTLVSSEQTQIPGPNTDNVAEQQ